MVIEIRLTKRNGIETGIWLQARPSLANFWIDEPGIQKIEYRILSDISNAPEKDWNKNNPFVELD